MNMQSVVTPVFTSHTMPLGGQEFDLDLNPYVGRMASRLVQSFASDLTGREEDRWAVIAEVLGFAAEAEQRLSEQRERISELEALAVTDSLTGIGNRRGLEDFLQRTLANAQRHGESGLIAYLDLDGFKSLNDRHGHALGDECLRLVAGILRDNIRSTDYAARCGGDEFVVVLTHSDQSGGMTRLRQLQDMINAASIHHEGATIRLQASMGTVTYGKGQSMQALMQAADASMYANKLKRRKNPDRARLRRIS